MNNKTNTKRTNNNTLQRIKAGLLTVLLSSLAIPALADDTEVFFKSATAINPNVLFIMDNSTSMSKNIDGKPRIQIMKDALKSVLNSEDINNINVGITNYGSTDSWRRDYANGIKFPIKPLNKLALPILEESLKDKEGEVMWQHHRMPAPPGTFPVGSYYSRLNPPTMINSETMTVREYLPLIADTWQAKGNTPIVDALLEAALYFRGAPIRYQDAGGYGGRGHYYAAAHPSTYSYPEGLYNDTDYFPGHQFPYTPSWYANNLSNNWYTRRLGPHRFYYSTGSRSYHSDSKVSSPFWAPLWIRCPSNTGNPNYTPIKNSGPSKVKYCRIMRNDFVKYLKNQLGNAGSVFNDAIASINSNQSSATIDSKVRKAIRQVTPAQLSTISTLTIKRGISAYNFTGTFSRCHIAPHVVCEAPSQSWRRDRYQCLTTGSEECRAWNYEKCVNPNDKRIVNEVVCDFNQNLSTFLGAKYTSPITGDCQSNYIVLMSDGKPEYSTGDTRSRFSWSGNHYTSIPKMIGKSACKSNHYTAGICGPDLTEFLANTDNMPDDNIAEGKQTVKTMVIGFSDTVADDPHATAYLRSLVTVEDKPETTDKEGFFIATNEAKLVESFSNALKQISEEVRSQASPGYSVNVRSGLEHEDDIFIPVFDKSLSSAWSGNLKKFKLTNRTKNGKTDRIITGKTMVDGKAVPAMTELGLFKPEAWDFWSTSDTADGNSVEDGGVASLLSNPGTRKLYSNLSSNPDLSAEKNHIRPWNPLITNEMVGQAGKVNTEAYRKRLIRFIRGWQRGKINEGASYHMGDMLHSEPVIITYANGDATHRKEQYIFAATNEGYLHAFDADTGEEKFAFMPKKLFKNIEIQFNDDDQTKHVYGIDGGISYLQDGAKTYLFFGLRRGGRAYYALDVSNINRPRLMWKIDGENGGDFARLGQTWSMPYITNVLHGGKEKTALVFSGGNDTKYDYGDGDDYDYDSVTTDMGEANVGNDIFIVNAKTGALLWSMRQSMQRTDVKYAIPGGIRILDISRNGLLDRMYFADTGGNVWRLDLHENLSEPTKSRLVKVAALGGNGENARKFYNEPDVAQITDSGRKLFSISIGSGLRPHPINDKISDHMFILLEENPYGKVVETGNHAYNTITIDDLANVAVSTSTSHDATNITKTLVHTGFSNGDGDDVKKITQTDKHGWFVKFPDDGEKVLAPSITFEGSIVFTTLVPKALTSGELINACLSPATQGRIYALNILTGEASIDMDKGSSDPDDNDTFSVISASEIPGKPQRIFNSLECQQGQCKHDVDIRIGKKSSEVSGKNISDIESVYWNDPNTN